jgi:hypothetical protein
VDDRQRNTRVAGTARRHTLSEGEAVSALREKVARALARAFLAGSWHRRTLMARGDEAVDAGGAWLAELAFAVVQRFPRAPLDEDALATFVSESPHFSRAWRRRWIPHRAPRLLPVVPQMRASRWDVPAIPALGDLAAWLLLDWGALAWFSDRKGLERSAHDQALGHYRRRWIPRGERLPRLLEAPRPRLKGLQRRVLKEILAKIPPHDAAHGFVSGRSPLTHAALHSGRRLVVRFDLETFFTSIAPPRALGVFRAAGYPEEVARTLLGLCTTQTPESVLRAAPFPSPFTPAASHQRFSMLRRLAEWHLPQGAPTSPALANLVAFGLDVRLRALAEARGLIYSRYADDLTFSGDHSASLGGLTASVERVVLGEGFRLNHSKTRVMRAHGRQEVTGVVVNAKPNLGRAEFDRLKAVIHRCAVGPLPAEAAADPTAFRASLMGRIAWARHLAPVKGERLRRGFELIRWPDETR